MLIRNKALVSHATGHVAPETFSDDHPIFPEARRHHDRPVRAHDTARVPSETREREAIHGASESESNFFFGHLDDPGADHPLPASRTRAMIQAPLSGRSSGIGKSTPPLFFVGWR